MNVAMLLIRSTLSRKFTQKERKHSLTGSPICLALKPEFKEPLNNINTCSSYNCSKAVGGL
jgi:hypothetical protein